MSTSITIEDKAVDQVWLSSDYHFDHTNILKYCDRPFATVHDMNEHIIAEHNKLVAPRDFVYFLGDFAFKNADVAHFRRRMNGQFFFVKGNHDKNIGYNDKNFGWVKDRYELKVGLRKFVLDHYPLLSWNGDYHGSVQCFGHTHQKVKVLDSTKMRVNVGVDAWDFKPANIDQIMDLFKSSK